jgi:hypothetical protein
MKGVRTGCRIPVSPNRPNVVGKKRPSTNGGVVRPAHAPVERISADGGIILTKCIAKERLESHCRIVWPCCEVEKGVITLSGVLVGIASVWRWVYRSHAR